VFLDLHGRPARRGGLAERVPHRDGSDGEHGRVLDPLFQILEARGFTVFLVNAHHVKNVPGRKSDVSDCQWLQYLHSVGLLRGSFRPEQAVCTVRSILRHRDSLVQMASSHVQHMQKALDQMNLQLHHVISRSRR